MRLQSYANRLLGVTQGCRPDMHEPDEQDLKAHVVGYDLDNEMGDHIDSRAVEAGYQEFVICLEQFQSGGQLERLKAGEPLGDKTKFVRENINLASLIALAKMGVILAKNLDGRCPADVQAEAKALLTFGEMA